MNSNLELYPQQNILITKEPRPGLAQGEKQKWPWADELGMLGPELADGSMWGVTEDKRAGGDQVFRDKGSPIGGVCVQPQCSQDIWERVCVCPY